MNTTIMQLEAERKQRQAELIGTAKLLIMELNGAIHRLEDESDGSINELGFFQGKAARFDILCAEYEMTKRHLKMAQAAQETE